MKTETAEMIRELPVTQAGAKQALFRFRGRYFVVSSVYATFTGFETLVFPADETGEITNWSEVAGGRGMSRLEAVAYLESCSEEDLEGNER
jgi:hypothetical protein